MRVEKIIIHHSAGEDNPGLDWAGIKRYHIEERGWVDIGYHAGIERVGERLAVLYGRSWWREGAHCVGMNNKSLGFCFVGNYQKNPPDERMIKEASRFLVEWLRIYGLTPEDVVGHRDYAKTDCPGKAFDLEVLREEIRRQLFEQEKIWLTRY